MYAKRFPGAMAALFFVLSVGCAVQPRLENPADYIGAAYASIEATSNTLVNMYERGVIQKEDAVKMYRRLIEAKNLVDMASSLLSEGKPGSAMATIRVAQRILTQIEKDLRERERERNRI